MAYLSFKDKHAMAVNAEMQMEGLQSQGHGSGQFNVFGKNPYTYSCHSAIHVVK